MTPGDRNPIFLANTITARQYHPAATKRSWGTHGITDGKTPGVGVAVGMPVGWNVGMTVGMPVGVTVGMTDTGRTGFAEGTSSIN